MGDAWVAGAAGLFGLLIGSFLNVVIYRVPAGLSVVSPPSACPGCDTRIRPYDNVPVASWLVLRGRCRDCGVHISVRYPAVELLTGVLFAAAGLRFGFHLSTLAFAAFFAVLVALSGIDLDHRLLPRSIIYPASAAGALLLGAASLEAGAVRPFVDALIGGALGFVVLFVVHLVQPHGMGFGDVRLAGYIGLNVGWLGLAHVAVALFGGFLFGAVVGVVLIATGRGGRRTAVPFGPFLASGAVVAVLWGGPLVRAWLG